MAPRRALRRQVRAPAAEAGTWRPRTPPAPPIASLGSVPALPSVQRQCDGCAAEEEGEGLAVQPRLKVGAVDDRFEREADSVADKVMRMPGPASASTPISDLADDQRVSRREFAPGAASGGELRAELGRSGEGSPLAPDARGFLEPRFGHDLGHVRVHDDSRAGALAESIGALAFTHGSDIYFRSGEYDPASGEGRRLLAHEIAHTFQQGGGGAEAPAIQRAVIRYGNVRVQVNYGPVINVPPADLPGRVLASLASYIGAAATPSQEAAVRALGAGQQNWLLFALQLLIDNAAAGSGLARTDAVDRLVVQAPLSTTSPLPDPDNAFVHEALQVSGWLQRALANPLAAPTGADSTAIHTVLHPPMAGGSAGTFDEPQLRRRLSAGIRHLFNQVDPGNWTTVARRSISQFQALGDVIHEEARSFFAPYAEAPIGNLYSLRPRWQPSANISDTASIVPDAARRRSFVRNRARMVGGNTTVTLALPDTNIFSECNFDSQANAADFEAIVNDLAADSTLQPIIDRLIQHTGFQRGEGAASQIGLVMEYNRGRMDECEAQWAQIDTLCHEVLHALAHPAFSNSARLTDRPQVVTEGFTEVLGNQLFNGAIIPRATRDRPFKDLLEAGVTGAPCPPPAVGTIGYGDSGAGAETIRSRVGDNNFRAAYFLGRPELAGIR